MCKFILKGCLQCLTCLTQRQFGRKMSTSITKLNYITPVLYAAG